MELLFLTELLGLRVHDVKGRAIGRLKDAALVPMVHPSRVDRFLIGTAPTWLTVRDDQVGQIDLGGVYLRDEQLTPYHDDEYMLRIVRDLLDQQIIDVNGRKVVRVTTSRSRFAAIRTATPCSTCSTSTSGSAASSAASLQGVVPPAWIRRLQQPIPPNSIRWDVRATSSSPTRSAGCG